jgi:hypothetical protein
MGEYPRGYCRLTAAIPPGVSADLDDSEEKTSVIPVEGPEIDAGRLAEAVKGSAVVPAVHEPGGRHA